MNIEDDSNTATSASFFNDVPEYYFSEDRSTFAVSWYQLATFIVEQMVDLISDDVTNIHSDAYKNAHEARQALERIVSLALDIRETHAAIFSTGKINGSGGAAESLNITSNAVYFRIATHSIDSKMYRLNVSDSELFRVSGKMRNLVQQVLPYLLAFEDSKNGKKQDDEVVEEMERRNIFD